MSKKLNNMAPFQKFTLKDNITDKFTLTVAELKDYVDFDVKRIYFVQDFKKDTGAHCHFIEDEFFIMVKGSCMALIDCGNGIEEVPLNRSDAFFAGHYVWHGFKNPSADAVLLALSSTNYNPDRSDYLENYDEYLKIRDEKLSEYSI